MTDDDDKTGDAQAIIDAVEKYVQPTFLVREADATGVAHVALVPSGFDVHTLKPYIDAARTRPERKRGTTTLTTLDSFITHVKRFALPHTVVYAVQSRERPCLIAVYDHHAAAGGPAEFGEYRSRYPFPLSDEWTAWSRSAQSGMSQADFAEFIESHIGDVATADDVEAGALLKDLGLTLATPAQLLSLSRGLKLRVDQEVTQRPNLSSGEIELTFKETHSGHVDTGGQPVKIPGGFLLAIPVFKDGIRYKVPARLRYRVQNGKVSWWFALHRAEAALDDAIREAANTVEHITGLPLFYGSPDSLSA